MTICFMISIYLGWCATFTLHRLFDLNNTKHIIKWSIISSSGCAVNQHARCIFNEWAEWATAHCRIFILCFFRGTPRGNSIIPSTTENKTEAHSMSWRRTKTRRERNTRSQHTQRMTHSLSGQHLQRAPSSLTQCERRKSQTKDIKHELVFLCQKFITSLRLELCSLLAVNHTGCG